MANNHRGIGGLGSHSVISTGCADLLFQNKQNFNAIKIKTVKESTHLFSKIWNGIFKYHSQVFDLSYIVQCEEIYDPWEAVKEKHSHRTWNIWTL